MAAPAILSGALRVLGSYLSREGGKAAMKKAASQIAKKVARKALKEKTISLIDDVNELRARESKAYFEQRFLDIDFEIEDGELDEAFNDFSKLLKLVDRLLESGKRVQRIGYSVPTVTFNQTIFSDHLAGDMSVECLASLLYEEIQRKLIQKRLKIKTQNNHSYPFGLINPYYRVIRKGNHFRHLIKHLRYSVYKSEMLKCDFDGELVVQVSQVLDGESVYASTKSVSPDGVWSKKHFVGAKDDVLKRLKDLSGDRGESVFREKNIVFKPVSLPAGVAISDKIRFYTNSVLTLASELTYEFANKQRNG